jgi:hypothetical protein
VIKDISCYAEVDPADFVLSRGANLPVGLSGESLDHVCSQVQGHAVRYTDWTSFNLTDINGNYYQCLLTGTATQLYRRPLIPTVQQVTSLLANVFDQGKSAQLDCLLVRDFGLGLPPLMLRLDPERDHWVVHRGNDSASFGTLPALSRILDAWVR